MAGFLSLDVYRDLAGISAKRAKKTPSCERCGGGVRSFRAKLCLDCAKTAENESRARTRAKRKQECTS